MKKFDLPLVADVAAISLAALLFFFCVFRFYLHSLAAAAALGFLCAAAAGMLAFLLFSRRRGKRRSEKGQKKQADELALRLALCGRNECAKLFERALNAANGDGYARAEGGRVRTKEGTLYPLFRLDGVDADSLREALAGRGERRVYAVGCTDRAAALAEAFGVKICGAEEALELLEAGGCLPELPALPEKKKENFLRGLRGRLRRSNGRGCAFSGIFLLLFSLFAVFPVYYLVSGGLLLALGLFLRFFAKN